MQEKKNSTAVKFNKFNVLQSCSEGSADLYALVFRHYQTLTARFATYMKNSM